LISRTRADRLRDGVAASIDYSDAFVDCSGAFVDYIEVFGDCSGASLITAMPNVSASWPQSAGAKSRRRENP